MYAARRPIRSIRPVSPYQARSPADIAWKLTWPFFISNILACAMILCILIIGALEIASLAKSTSTFYYGNTSATGAGFWCGFFFIIAAALILMLNFMLRTQLWASITLVATIVAACLAIILLALDAKAVQDGLSFYTSLPDKTQVLAAQLAFAIFELLLCFAIIGIYIIVFISAPRRLHRQRGVIY